MGRVTQQGFIFRLTNMFANARTCYYQKALDPGEYICFVKIDFDIRYDKDCIVNLAVYGDKPCQI